MTSPRYIDDENISIKEEGLGPTKMIFRSDAGTRMGVRM